MGIKRKNKQKYISLKEAAKISGYSSDYIGFLIRERKIRGKKVLKKPSWRVYPDDLLKYCKKSKYIDIRDFYLLKKKYISLKEAAKISGYSSDYIGDLLRKGKIKGKKVYLMKSWLVTEEDLMKYKRKIEIKKKNFPLIKRLYFHTLSAAKIILNFGWRLGLVTFILILLATFGPAEIFRKTIGALIQEEQTINFYTTNCVNHSFNDKAWQNPNNAQGEPEVSEVGAFGSFSETNSADYKGGIASLVCDNFRLLGEIPEDSREQVADEEVILEKETDSETPPTGTELPPTEETEGTEETEALLEEDVVPDDSETPPTETELPPTEETEVLPEEDSTPEPEPEPEPESTPATETVTPPTSLLEKVKNFFKSPTIKAQETITPEDLENIWISSARIKFSLAIGEKTADLFPVFDASETETELPPTEETEVLPEEDSTPEPEPEPEPESTPATETVTPPTSLLEKVKNFFKSPTIKAQETIESIETVSSLDESIPDESIDQDIIPEPVLDAIISDTTTEDTKDKESIELPSLDSLLVIWYSLDGKNWEQLDTISEYSTSNFLNDGYFTYDAPFLKSREDVNNLKIKIEGVVDGKTKIVAFLDSVWIEVHYQEEDKFDLRVLKTNWGVNEEPEFELVNLSEKDTSLTERLTAGINSFLTSEEKQEPEINIDLVNPRKSTFSLRKGDDFITETHSPTKIKIFKQGNLQPGLYKIIVSFKKGNLSYSLEEEFTWGVLAINTNKSIYLPEEEVYLQMAVLRNDGHTVCSARLELRIISQDLGIDTLLSTQDGTIQYSGECGPNNVTDVPDYFAYYQVGEPGIYEMKLKNLDTGYEITDSFEVRESVPFDIERIGPTRIYPLVSYEMKMKIRANQDFSGQVRETVPTSFDIQSSVLDFQLSSSGDEKYIIWQVDWKEGEIYEINYQFDAPDISPYLYLLGPLEIGDFKEIRQWQLASDAIGFVTGSGISNFTNNGGDCSLTLSGIGLLEDDLVIAAYAIGDDDDVNFDMVESSSTWTEVADLFSDDTFDSNLGVYYKVMPASPDASVTFTGLGGSDTDTICVAMAFRGVDTTTPMDVTATTATGLDTFHADPPSIDYNSPFGVYTVIVGTNAHDDALESFTNPTGYTTDAVSQAGSDATDSVLGIGYRTNPSDPEDPGTMTSSGTDDTTFSWAAVTMALRPYVPTLTISGRVCSAEPCNDTNGSSACSQANVVGLSVDGAAPSYQSCNTTTGAFSFSESAPSSSTITLFLDGNATDASAVIVSNGSDITDADFYDDTVVVRSQTGTISIADMLDYDSDEESGDIRFDAESGTVTVESGHELHIWTGDTFAPGGTVTLTAGSGSDLHIDDSAAFTAGGATSIGGSWTADTGATFTDNDYTVTFTCTSTGQTITTNNQDFGSVTFNGSGGEWTLQDTLTVTIDLTMTAGTLLGSQNVTVYESVVGTAGVINLSGGTFEQRPISLENFGPTTASTNWTFSTLWFSTSSSLANTIIITQSCSTCGVTVSTALNIGRDGDSYTTTLWASDKTWTLSNSGTPLVISATRGNLDAETSTFNYTGTAATTVAAEIYYNLGLGTSADSTAVDYTLGGNTTVSSVLTVGNAGSSATDTLSASSYTLTLSGDGTPFVITSQGDFSSDTSTVEYTSGYDTNITATTYNNLELNATSDTLDETLRPDNAGDYAEMGRGGTCVAGSNYQCVDDPGGHDSDSTYVYTDDSVVGPVWEQDLHSMQDTNIPGGATINNIKFYIVARSTNNGYKGGARTFIKSGSTYVSGSENNPSTVYSTFLTQCDKDPSGSDCDNGSDWTTTAINNLQNGIELKTGYDSGPEQEYPARGTQVYAVVNYTVTPVFTLGTAGSQTITTNGYFTLGDGTNEVLIEGDTYNPTVNIGSNLTISANATWDAGSGTATISGNFTNSGSFNHSSGTVTFNGAGISEVTYSTNTTFYNLTVATAGKQMKFDEAQQTNIAGLFNIQGTNCTTGRVFLDSYVNDNQWDIDATGSIDVDYADIEDSNAITDITSGVDNSTQDNNNNSGWTIGSGECVSTITVSGGCFTDDTEGTPCTDDGSDEIKVAVNGSVQAGSDTTVDGSWSFTINQPASGATMVFFRNGEATESEECTTVTKYDGSGNVDLVKMYQSQLVIGTDTGSANSDQTVSIADMDTTGNGYENSDDEDVLFDVTAGSDLTVDAEANKTETLYVISGDTYRPASGGGGDTTTHHLKFEGTLTTDTNTVNVAGDFTNTGTFTASSSTIVFNGSTAQTFTTNSATYNAVTLNNTGTDGANDNVTISGALDVNSTFSITNGDLILNSGDPSVNTAGDVSIGSSAFVTKGAGTWTFDGGTQSLTDSSSGQDLGIITIGPSTTTTVNTGSDVTVTNLTINGDDVLNITDDTLTITGSGTPFTQSGTFTVTNSTVKYTADGDTNITNTTYNNLEFSPTITTNRVYTGAGVINANGTFNINPSAGSSLSLTFNLGGTTSVTGATTIQRTSSATSVLDTVSNYIFNTGSLSIQAGGTLDGNASALDSNGDVTIAASGTLTSTSGNFNVGGSWSNSVTGVFTHSSGTVIFDATTSGKTISDGGDPFYDLDFTGDAGGWTYTDGASTAPNSTIVNCNLCTVNFINAKTASGPTVTQGMLYVDWYVGVHVVDAQNTSTKIDTGDADITISENSGTPAATIWRHNGVSWGSAASSQTTGTDSNGNNPQPNSDGAIKIREYSNMDGSPTYYLYNIQISWQGSYGEYDYYADYGNNYLTSSANTGSGHDEVIDDDWYRSTPGTMNAVGTVNDPPTTGSWYCGMLKGLEVVVTGTSINFGNLDDGNNFTVVAGTTTDIEVTTSATNGYVVTAWETQLMTCSDAGQCGSDTIQNFTLGTYANPDPWGTNCEDNSSYCGFGFTSDDPLVEGLNRYNNGTEYTFFPADSSGPVRVMDYSGPVGSQSYSITYKISVDLNDTAGPYSTTVVYIVTAEY